MSNTRSFVAFAGGILVAIAAFSLIKVYQFYDSLSRVIVHDRLGTIEAAAIRYHSRIVALKFDDGRWTGHVSGDGTLVVNCKNGEQIELGYVTTGPGQEFAVGPPCVAVMM